MPKPMSPTTLAAVLGLLVHRGGIYTLELRDIAIGLGESRTARDVQRALDTLTTMGLARKGRWNGPRRGAQVRTYWEPGPMFETEAGRAFNSLWVALGGVFDDDERDARDPLEFIARELGETEPDT